MRPRWVVSASLVPGVVALVLGLLAPLLLALGPSAPALAQDAAPAIALVVGNTRYPDSDAPLTTPLEDARALAAALRKRGFSVELGENLTKRGMQDAAERFLAKVRPGSTALVAFAGYGIQSGRQNYLIPVDVQIWSETDVQRDGLAVARLLAEIDRRGAATTYLALDAAHRNPFERRFRSYSTGLAPIAALPQSAVIIYSAAPGAVLKEMTGARSPFGTELANQVEGATALSQTVFDRTRVAITEATSGGQSPWVFASTRPPASSRPTAGTDAIPGPTASVGDAFRAAQRAGTRQAYEAFLAANGAGPFADLARLELARLASAPAPRPPEPQAPPQTEARLDPRPETRPDPRPEPRTEPRPPDPRPVEARPVDPRPVEPRPPEARPPADTRPAEARPPENRPVARPPEARPPEVRPPETKQAELRPPETTRPPEVVRPARAVLPYSESDRKLRADLTGTIAKNPNDVGSLYTRGQLLALHHEFGPALADFDAVVRLQPTDVEALNNRCWVRAILDEYDGALADCNAALRLRPKFLDALDSRGFLNLKIGLPRRAIADYDEALRVNNRHASALYGRGIARLRSGQAAEGRTDMANALAIDAAVADEFARFGIQ